MQRIERSQEWIKSEADRLTTKLNAHILREWPAHTALTRNAMVDGLVQHYLGDSWEHSVLQTFNKPPRIYITQYLGNFHIEGLD